MGKSPGKWLKSLLFGKKSKRKDSLKSSNEKGHNNNKGKEKVLNENSPIISDPILINTYNNNNNSNLPIIQHSNSSDLDSILPDNINPVSETNKLGLRNYNEVRENEAATNLQAAFRGFLARRAFWSLKGIIRLQGLVRGRLVRRQAISTLYALNGIIKLQALARGSIIRRSDICFQVHCSQIYPQNSLVCESGNEWKENFSKSSLGYKLISSEIGFMPLKIQYEKTDPNSVLSWLSRWEKAEFWKPILKDPKNPSISKSQPKKTGKPNSSNQTKPLKSKKQISKMNQAQISEPEKSTKTEPEKSTKIVPNNESQEPKINPRRFSLSPSSENPKPNLQNPKKPLRKVSNSVSEAEILKLSSNLKKSEIISNSSFDNTSSRTVQELEKNPSENSFSSNGDSSSKLHSRRSSISNINNNNINNNNNNNKLMPKSNIRRSSFSSGLEILESQIRETDSQSSASRTVPSYMAATASAKARIKGQVLSPRVVSPAVSSEGKIVISKGHSADSESKIGILRRHSLPSLNGRAKSDSPRIVNKTEKMVNAEWRR